MTKVIRLHKDDEILFIREQKRILKALNSSEKENIAFPFFPLLVELKNDYFEQKNIQELKNLFHSVQIEEATVLENQIFCSVKIKMSDCSEFSVKLLIGTLKKIPEEKNSINMEKSISKNLRIFQIAEAKKSGIQTELWNPQWVKCR